MNKQLFKSLMVLNGDTNASLAEFLGISVQSVCNKINEKNGQEWKQGEMLMIKKRWNLSGEMVDRVFFQD